MNQLDIRGGGSGEEHGALGVEVFGEGVGGDAEVGGGGVGDGDGGGGCVGVDWGGGPEDPEAVGEVLGEEGLGEGGAGFD